MSADSNSPTPQPGAKPAPGAATEQQPTQIPQSDSGDKGVQARIDGLTAERERLKAQLERERAERSRLEESMKTDEQKRIEERAKEMHGPQLQRLTELETRLQTQADFELGKLPDEYKSLVSENAPPEERLRQIAAAKDILASKVNEPAPNVGSTANPQPPPGGRIYTWPQFHAWQELASSRDPAKRAQWKELKTEMQAAYREGRIK